MILAFRPLSALVDAPDYSGTRHSGPIPAPYPMQTTSPVASPPGSSVFTYYGKPDQNPNWAAVVDSDSNLDDNDKPQLESAGFETELIENTALRTRLEQIHQSAIGSSSHSRPTPANPRTPKRTLSSQSSMTLTPDSFISPTRTPSHHTSGPSNLLSFCGAESSQARSPVTPTIAGPENQYASFIHANGLTDFHPAIDLVRRRVVMFNWKDELLNLGIAQDLVADLMSAMNSYSQTERTFPSPFR